jgi:hypothetical protein
MERASNNLHDIGMNHSIEDFIHHIMLQPVVHKELCNLRRLKWNRSIWASSIHPIRLHAMIQVSSRGQMMSQDPPKHTQVTDSGDVGISNFSCSCTIPGVT